MKNAYSIIAALGALGFVVTTGACNSEDVDTTPSGGSGGAGGQISGGGNNTGGSGGGAVGDGNDACDSAVAMVAGQASPGQLETPADYDFYSFQATKGDLVGLFADAKPDNDPFADGYIDTVITVFDASGKRIAENDDIVPRSTQDSELILVAPETGTYCVRMADFCQWSADEMSDPCDTPPNITTNSYSLLSVVLPATTNGIVSEAEGVMEFATSTSSTTGYSAPLAFGSYDDKDDVDSFEFTIPADLKVTNGRLTTRVVVYPTGDRGNGSTASNGNVWITAAADPTGPKLAFLDVAAAGDPGRVSIQWPATAATKYWVHMQSGTFAAGNPFYTLFQSAGSSDNVEGVASNDTAGTAEALTKEDVSEFSLFTVVGNLPAGTDVDWFKLPLAGIAATHVVSTSCRAARIGSGIEQLTGALYKADGTTELGTGVETAAKDSELATPVALPSGETELLFKVSSANTTISGATSDHYRCAIIFSAPPAN